MDALQRIKQYTQCNAPVEVIPDPMITGVYAARQWIRDHWAYFLVTPAEIEEVEYTEWPPRSIK